MKKCAQILVVIGIIVFFTSIGIQVTYSVMQEIEADGKEELGDNPVFRNVLGIETREYFRGKQIPGEGIDWIYRGKTVTSAPWMRKIGFNKKVFWGYKKTDTARRNSRKYEIIYMNTIQIFLKIFIPGIFLIPGIWIWARIKIREYKAKKKTQNQ